MYQHIQQITEFINHQRVVDTESFDSLCKYSKDWRSTGEICTNVVKTLLFRSSKEIDCVGATRHKKIERPETIGQAIQSYVHTHTYIIARMMQNSAAVLVQSFFQLPKRITQLRSTLISTGIFFFFPFLDGNGKAESLHPRRRNSITAIDISDDD